MPRITAWLVGRPTDSPASKSVLGRGRSDMRRVIVAIVLSAFVSSLLVTVPSVGATGLSSDNVQYIATIPLEAGTWSTARIHDGYLYVSGSKSFSIYDISEPLAPQLVSHTITGFQFVNEDIDTNGEILLLSDERAGRRFMVYDVSDKSIPVKLAELTNIVDHSYACVLGCKWAYGAGGNIIDLRDPSDPKPVSRWVTPPTPLWGFDTNEVAPGFVLTASRVIHLLDARSDPANPKLLAQAATADNRLIHSVHWPRNAKDRFVLVQSETSPKPICDQNSGALMTWDARGWRKNPQLSADR